jgi:uncharacterized protein YneF (UPF0154 family)
MMGRIVGMLVTFAIIGYLFYAFFGSNNRVKEAVNSNPTVKEQQKALKDETGVDATDQKALMQYSIDQAKQIQDYQNQAPPQQ